MFFNPEVLLVKLQMEFLFSWVLAWPFADLIYIYTGCLSKDRPVFLAAVGF